jgi:peptidoglycan hydrolase-like amidase
MDDSPDACGLRQWRPDARREPVVRVGVILAEDAMAATELRVPDVPHVLSRDGQAGGAARTVANARVAVRLSPDGRGVTLAIENEPPESAPSWRLAPRDPRPPARGQGVLVRDVVAGRGFHWQKHVDQTLPGELRVLPAGDGKSLVLVNELPLETYLAGVITSEMSGRCPAAFLRAQCITARSWLLAMTEPKHLDQPFDRCNDDCCQRYQGTGDLSDGAIDAVRSTRGLTLVTRAGAGLRVVDANYSKCCGGIVEIPEHVWGAPKPGLAPAVDAPPDSAAQKFLPVTDANLADYLAGDWLARANIYCSPSVVPEADLPQYLGRVDVPDHYFRWTQRYAHDELRALLRRKLGAAAESIDRITDLRVMARGISGRATRIVVAYIDPAGAARELPIRDQYKIRQALHPSFLYSSAFQVEIDRDAAGALKSLTLRGAGWGHGVGLCQIGALGMSLRGMDHESIVRRYFPNAQLERLYD